MYKDKEKQRQANRDRQRRYKERQKGVIPEGVTDEPKVTPSIQGFGGADCMCQHCLTNRRNGLPKLINHGTYKKAHELGRNELNRQTLPGDPDYDGICTPAWIAKHKVGC